MEEEIKVDGRWRFEASAGSLKLYAVRFVGSAGRICWNIAVEGLDGYARNFWISASRIHDAITHLWADSLGRSVIVDHGPAEEISDSERTAIDKAVAAWEEKLTEYEQRVDHPRVARASPEVAVCHLDWLLSLGAGSL